MFNFIRERQIPIHSIQMVPRVASSSYAYFYPYGRTDSDTTWLPVTKSFTSTLVGLAIERGLIGDVHQPVLGFFPVSPSPNLTRASVSRRSNIY